jgi:hypothetical protein
MRWSRPSHGTVVAYLALFVALGSGAYAATQVGSKDVTDDSLRSRDLRDGTAVTGRDVRDDKLTGDDVREKTLDATGFTAVTRGGGGCDPSMESPIVCAQATITLAQSSKVLMIGSGGFFSDGGPARATCAVKFDGQLGGDTSPGEVATDNTELGASESFTATGLSTVLPAGPHSVTLECNQVLGDARISQPSIAAIAVGAGSG